MHREQNADVGKIWQKKKNLGIAEGGGLWERVVTVQGWFGFAAACCFTHQGK